MRCFKSEKRSLCLINRSEIGGENDIYAAYDKLQEMKSRCPQAEIYMVPESSHRPHMPTDKVKEVNTRILEFLKTCT